MFKIRTEDKEPIKGIENKWPQRTSSVYYRRSRGHLVRHSREVQPAEDCICALIQPCVPEEFEQSGVSTVQIAGD